MVILTSLYNFETLYIITGIFCHELMNKGMFSIKSMTLLKSFFFFIFSVIFVCAVFQCLKTPVDMPCGHDFCRGCWESWVYVQLRISYYRIAPDFKSETTCFQYLMIGIIYIGFRVTLKCIIFWLLNKDFVFILLSSHLLIL